MHPPTTEEPLPAHDPQADSSTERLPTMADLDGLSRALDDIDDTLDDLDQRG